MARHPTPTRRAHHQRHRLSLAIADTNEHVHQLADETRLRIAELAAESQAADKQLGARIESLVSAIGQFIAGRQ